MKIHFTVIGKPQGKQRPRFQRTHYGVKTYTPQQTVSYENLVKWTYAQEFPDVKLTGPISAEIIGYFPIPQSTSRRKREKMMLDDTPYTHKIDADNLAKIVLDSLNKIAYDDDAQVCRLQVLKFYSPYPRVEVYLEEMEADKKASAERGIRDGKEV